MGTGGIITEGASSQHGWHQAAWEQECKKELPALDIPLSLRTEPGAPESPAHPPAGVEPASCLQPNPALGEDSAVTAHLMDGKTEATQLSKSSGSQDFPARGLSGWRRALPACQVRRSPGRGTLQGPAQGCCFLNALPDPSPSLHPWCLPSCEGHPLPLSVCAPWPMALRAQQGGLAPPPAPAPGSSSAALFV